MPFPSNTWLTKAAADAIPFFVTWGLARSGAGNVLGNAVCDGVARTVLLVPVFKY